MHNWDSTTSVCRSNTNPTLCIPARKVRGKKEENNDISTATDKNKGTTACCHQEMYNVIQHWTNTLKQSTSKTYKLHKSALHTSMQHKQKAHQQYRNHRDLGARPATHHCNTWKGEMNSTKNLYSIYITYLVLYGGNHCRGRGIQGVRQLQHSDGDSLDGHCRCDFAHGLHWRSPTCCWLCRPFMKSLFIFLGVLPCGVWSHHQHTWGRSQSHLQLAYASSTGKLDSSSKYGEAEIW